MTKEELVESKDLVKMIMEFVKIPCQPGCMPDEKAFKTFCDKYPEIRELVMKMIWVNKPKQYHGEGSTFMHTQLVVKEMLKIEDHDDIDLIIAFLHDAREYDTLQDKISQIIMSLIIERFPIQLRDHFHYETIRRTLEDIIIDKEEQYLYRDLDEERNPDDTPYDHLTEKVGPLSMEIVDFIKDLQKNRKELFNNKGHETYGFRSGTALTYEQHLLEYCISNHMKYNILDRISNDEELKYILRGGGMDYDHSNLEHLCRIWIADSNGRISNDPKISLKDIVGKLKSNKTFDKLLKKDHPYWVSKSDKIKSKGVIHEILQFLEDKAK